SLSLSSGPWQEASSLSQQIPKIFQCQCTVKPLCAQNFFGESRFSDLRLPDLVFERITVKQAIRENGSRLVDAMNTICPRILDVRVHPGIKQKHVGCGRQIQPCAARFE